jgi:nicotinate-nucleotide adenylyltransferase
VRTGFPKAAKGQVIGLLGGSFDPPHLGHVHLTQEALKRFGLSHLWWLVTPGNPLKSHGPAALERRMEAARAMIRHPRVLVTDLETRLGTRYTAQTLDHLQSRYPGIRFVWLMGADNLAQIHRWRDWQDIFARMPVGVIARPGQGMAARLSPAARRFADARLPQEAAHLLGRSAAPAWCMVDVPLVGLSSSLIRARGDWPQPKT